MAYLPSIVAAVIGLLGAFEPQVNAFIVAHTSIAAIVAALGTILAHFLPSPTAPK